MIGGSLFLAFVIGIAFGWTLERAGLGSARKLVGQFYLTDFTVFKVMFSAIVTAMLGVFWLARVGVLDLSQVYVPETFLVPQLVGGLIFGAGFALAGSVPARRALPPQPAAEMERRSWLACSLECCSRDSGSRRFNPSTSATRGAR